MDEANGLCRHDDSQLPQSRDLVRAAEQQLTRDWWARRSEFDLRVSSLVVLECGAGDADAAALRLAALEGVSVLALTPEAEALADALVREVPLPAKAGADALHIAVAAVHGVAYLLTWNSRISPMRPCGRGSKTCVGGWDTSHR